MSDLSFIDLVAAWDMLVDQHLASAEWQAESRFLRYTADELRAFRGLLHARLKPPPDTPPDTVAMLREWSMGEVESLHGLAEAIGRRRFMELQAQANGVALELGRVFVRSIAALACPDKAGPAPPSRTYPRDFLDRPTVPAPAPDEGLLEQCRGSDPPTVIPPAYPEAMLDGVELVPSRRYISSSPPDIAVGAEDIDLDGLEEDT